MARSPIELGFFLGNPFRILGVPVDATAKAVDKSFSRAKALASIDREIEFDSDIPLAFEPERRMESLQAAKGKIEQLGDRLEHSLWWFWEDSIADQKAFAALRDGDESKAKETWRRVADGKPVSDSNYSSVRNLGLYYLGEAVATGSIRKRKLEKSFELLGAFMGSEEHLDTYLQMVSGSSRAPFSSGELKAAFSRNVARFLEAAKSRGAISVKNLGSYFRKFPDSISNDIAEEFIRPPTQQIEEVISRTQKELKVDPQTGLELAERLFELTEDSLDELEELLAGPGAYKLEIIRGNVASAVLGATTEYFNHVIAWDAALFEYEDPGRACLELSRRALLLCPSGGIANKLQTDIEYLEGWIADEPMRKLKPEFESLREAVDALPSQEAATSMASAARAKSFFGTSRRKLEKIKKVLGSNNEHYQSLSSIVASYTVGLCQGYLMAGGEPSEIQSTLTSVGRLYMNPDVRGWYTELKELIRSRYGSPAPAASRSRYRPPDPVLPESSPTESDEWWEAPLGCGILSIVAYFIFKGCS